MLLVKMDLKSASLLAKQNLGIDGIQADSSGILSEAKVREMSKSLSSLRLNHGDALPDDVVRYTGASSNRWALLTRRKTCAIAHHGPLHDFRFE